MTTAHPVPAPSPPDHPPPVQPACRLRAAVPRTFFEPGADRLTRHAEGVLQPTQTAALVIGTQDRFTLLVAITVRLRIFTTACATVTAQESLFPASRASVANEVATVAVATFKGDVNHTNRLPDHPRFLHYQKFVLSTGAQAARLPDCDSNLTKPDKRLVEFSQTSLARWHALASEPLALQSL